MNAGLRIDQLAEPIQTLGGHRVYPLEAVMLVQLGFCPDEVMKLLASGVGQTRSDAGLRGRAREKLAEVERKLADLRTIRDALRQAIDAGCDDLVTCAHTPRCPLPFAEPDRSW